MVESRALEGQKSYARDMEEALLKYLEDGGFNGDLQPAALGKPRRQQYRRVSSVAPSEKFVDETEEADAYGASWAAKGGLESPFEDAEVAHRSRLLSQVIPILLVSFLLTLLFVRLFV